MLQLVDFNIFDEFCFSFYLRGFNFEVIKDLSYFRLERISFVTVVFWSNLFLVLGLGLCKAYRETEKRGKHILNVKVSLKKSP